MITRRTKLVLAVVLVVVGFAFGWYATGARADPQPPSGNTLPKPAPAFSGKIGRTIKDSKPDFPKELHAPPGAPNVLLIMTDDVGFGAASTFGGPIPTPAMTRIADNGLRYNEFHTTALCSPTRAALITGRNHHSAATGTIMEFATGFPGYDTLMPPSVGTVGEMLKYNGYSTAWFGKNHNVPDWQTSSSGPFDYWPNALGFDYFFGFLGGDANQWHTPIYENNVAYESPEQLGDKPKHFDELLADRAISWIRGRHAIAPQKPFFAYYVSGTAHAPHHAPREWIDQFKGKFDQGWDKVREETLARQKQLGVVPANTRLTPRPKEIPAWDSLNAQQKKVYARMMEVYAGTLAHSDHEIGRVLDAVAQIGALDNTVVIYIMGDNGASAEGSLQGTGNEVGTAANGVVETLDYLTSIADQLGGPMFYNHYPVGWAHAMDSPFQWAKQVASHFGGTRNGMVISWPKRIKERGVRSQFCHVTDITPTILELTGVAFPSVLNGVTQRPLEGTSLVYSFADAGAPTHHATQYFEMFANRAIYHDGWIASTTPLRLPWETYGASPNPDDFKWELYHLTDDFSQADDLAAREPAKLKELQALFDSEAKKYQVYPLDSRFAERVDPSVRPSLTRGRTDFANSQGMIRIPEGSSPDVKNKSFRMTADVEIPNGGGNGVLGTLGGRFGGWAMLLLDGKPEFAYAYSNQPQHKYRIVAPQALAPGKHTVVFDFTYDGGGLGKGGNGVLSVDGKKVAQGRIDHTIRARFSLDEGMDFGEDTGTPVIEQYAAKMPFRFNGKLERFGIHLGETRVGAVGERKLRGQVKKAAAARE
jgi:arylsulfatase